MQPGFGRHGHNAISNLGGHARQALSPAGAAHTEAIRGAELGAVRGADEARAVATHEFSGQPIKWHAQMRACIEVDQDAISQTYGDEPWRETDGDALGQVIQLAERAHGGAGAGNEPLFASFPAEKEAGFPLFLKKNSKKTVGAEGGGKGCKR
jgi:hypothetical protein